MATSAGADVVVSMREYLHKMLSDICGMKVLILDVDTMAMVSMVETQTNILQREVFLVERLDAHEADTARQAPMKHLNAVVFVRPTAENMLRLRHELTAPRYGEYHVFFSNVLRPSYLEDLAEYDTLEVVRQVQEFYGDYHAVNAHLFGLGTRSRYVMESGDLAAAVTDRSTAGLLALLLALKKAPAVRYTRASTSARRVAQMLSSRIDEESKRDSLFDFRRTREDEHASGSTLVLVLDRRDDPVTPLLTQWTYQAMVHELVGITNNRVVIPSLSGAGGEEVVLNTDCDKFYASNLYSNFGDLGENMQQLVDDFQAANKSTSQIASIEDMKTFIENYPAFRAAQGTVQKHVALVSELSRLVEERALMEVSELEQELACSAVQHFKQHSEELIELLEKPALTNHDRLRLCLLFALRYEREMGEEGNRFTRQLKETLFRLGFEPDQIGLLDAMLRHAGAAVRTPGLWGREGDGAYGALKKVAKRSMKGIENVYTQHKPLLANVLDELLRGKLKDALYPALRGGALEARRVPQCVVVFMVGGVTYAEAAAVSDFNQRHKAECRVLLGSNTICNSRQFLADLSCPVRGP